MSQVDMLRPARPLALISASAYVALLAAGIALVALVCRTGPVSPHPR